MTLRHARWLTSGAFAASFLLLALGRHIQTGGTQCMSR